MQIPIENIYYLLCYAWDRLEERDLISVSTTDSQTLLGLLARVLISGTSHLLKRGLDRGYISEQEDTRFIRGRIDFSSSIKRNLLLQKRVVCEFDELSFNVLHNRILKTTLGKLLRCSNIEKEQHQSLVYLYRALHEVEETPITSTLFSRVQLHSNNAFYGFLLDICQLIYANTYVNEEDGDWVFRDFLRDEKQMALLFEHFVRNFYKNHQKRLGAGCQVIGSEIIGWDISGSEDSAQAYLPRMKTDISIKWPTRYLVIETKYYYETLQNYYDTEKIHSPNLYQILAYLRNLEAKEGIPKNREGILLYPTVQKDLNLEFGKLSGHRVLIKTLNLKQPWKQIEERLLSLF